MWSKLKLVVALWHPSAFCNDWLPLPHILIVQSLQESIRGPTYLAYWLQLGIILRFLSDSGEFFEQISIFGIW